MLLLPSLEPAVPAVQHLLAGPAACLLLHAATGLEPTSQLLARSRLKETAGLTMLFPSSFAAAAPKIVQGAEQLIVAASFTEASVNGGRTAQQLLWQLQHAPMPLLLLALDRMCSALCHERDDPLVTLTKVVVIAEGMCWAVKAAAWLLVPGVVGCCEGWLQVVDTLAAASWVLTWSCDCEASAAAGEADSIWLQLQLMYSRAPCKSQNGHNIG